MRVYQEKREERSSACLCGAPTRGSDGEGHSLLRGEPASFGKAQGIPGVCSDREGDGGEQAAQCRRLSRAAKEGDRHERWWALSTEALDGNQLSRIPRDYTPDRRDPEDIVRAAWRHAEPGRNALAPGCNRE